MADTVSLYAAGSLTVPLSEIAHRFAQAHGQIVRTTFAPSGLLRQRIEDGIAADVFASADMAHPHALEAAGRAGSVRSFARNTLCVLARPGIALSSKTVLNALLDPRICVGTSTPVADPSGDYAWALFRKADTLMPGAFDILSAKALQLTGGPGSETPSVDRDIYSWVMEQGQADVFITYRTNALRARRQAQSLQVIDLPAALRVGAEYGLTVIKGASEAATAFADYILGPAAQAVLARDGFDAPGP